jgi:hypothetical protein
LQKWSTVISQAVYGQGLSILLPARWHLQTQLLVFLELLTTYYEPAVGGVHKLKLFIVGVTSGTLS